MVPGGLHRQLTLVSEDGGLVHGLPFGAVHCPETSYTPLLLHLAEMVPEDAKLALQPPPHVDCTAAVPVLQLSQV